MPWEYVVTEKLSYSKTTQLLTYIFAFACCTLTYYLAEYFLETLYNRHYEILSFLQLLLCVASVNQKTLLLTTILDFFELKI